MNSKFAWSTVILRVVLGITFFIHGLVKFQGGIENTVGWFDSIGIPGFFAYVVASLELVGGLLLVVGFGTRIVAALFVLLMLGATFKAKLALGFLGNGQMAGYELDIALMAIALFLAVNGSNMLSLDQAVFKGQQNNNAKAA
ncbi:DoxX family protein [Metabacillus sediminilitoris]|uniref:DoxX family protein n=1 Tax=Metabacillus sediminilitoris TaxID=2567941 RepID=A0A4S4BPW7_9BACI|nr:DoxX family protein [Metabacillus sediminilitoris]QGQ47692.1 DoxX family membrane protein [Metabacillus sediminilitoris]THF76798.1 DoxX family protein [Metabacillus sediminilitoris]